MNEPTLADERAASLVRRSIRDYKRIRFPETEVEWERIRSGKEDDDERWRSA